ncbi:GFA family protein [Luteimonas marina]|uniref:GFA family protein n=1 Tax=Luteimonas marina TaxID=488485 RepID=A0A5C5TT12_9GAMM|nr:GFA family protein [Luteimonas marina]
MISGHCNCGSVRFEFEGTAEGVFICHCSICRRATGANGIAVVLVQDEQFRWLQGEEHIVKWSKPDSQWETWFCKTCGSRLPGKNDSERMFIPAGLLPGTGIGLSVRAHLWVDSKAEWDALGDQAQQHAERHVGSAA